MKSVSVADLAKMVDGEVVGDASVMVTSFAPLTAAGPGQISFLVKVITGDQLEALKGLQAAALIAPQKLEGEFSFPLIKVADPYLAEAKIHSFLVTEEFVAKGVHPRAYVGDDCELSDEITIKPLACVGDRVKIGARVTIESGAVIGDDVVIGDDCTIKANATLNERTVLGNKVVIHSGTVIGSDGYGYATDKMGNHFKRPQMGCVQIDDDVEIGSNTCVDCATYGVTHIKSGVKIDNQVQLGHNVVIGENSLIVAQAGIAGSTKLGRNVVLGARAATVGHLDIGDRVMMAAGAGAMSSIEAGSVVGGIPAMPVRQWRKAALLYTKLPELHKDIRRLKKDVEALNCKDLNGED